MDKTRDLFKKIGDIKGTFHSRMGMVKNRNGKGLAEEKNTQRNYIRKVLMTLITMMMPALT